MVNFGHQIVVFAMFFCHFRIFVHQFVVFDVVRDIFVDFGYQFVVFAVICGIFSESKTVVRIVCGVSACFDVFCPKDQESHLM